MKNIFIYTLLALSTLVVSCSPTNKYISKTLSTPKNYIYTSAGDFETIKTLLTRSDISGVQVVYNWKQLEKNKGQYDFSLIDKHLQYISSLNKKLFIQIQDRFFSPEAKYIPKYLMTDIIYNGGLTPQSDNPGENKPMEQGWVTQQWNPNVQSRYQQLITELAKRYDGEIEGINLPETAVDINQEKDTTGFTCDKYFQSEIENILHTKNVFKKSTVVQYLNFWPCEWNNDHQYMSRFFELAYSKNIGLGGPDIVPNKKPQMANSYPFFNKYRNKLALVAMSIQEPTLTYTNPKTNKPFTKEEFIAYAKDYLGTDIIFWSAESPWINN